MGKKQNAKWRYFSKEEEDFKVDRRAHLKFDYMVRKLSWHPKGDYFSTMAKYTQTSNQVQLNNNISIAGFNSLFE
jgi:hypothetical protein